VVENQMQSQDRGNGGGTGARVDAFKYPAGPELPLPLLEAFAGAVLPESAPETNGGASPPRITDEKRIAELEQRLTAETQRSFEAGRERGRQEGRAAEQQAQSAARAAQDRQRLEHAAKLVETFAGERDRYLNAAEHEVVKLSLAVAARVLRREAQMDPLLLTGAVRVALGQLSASTQVKLRVPAADLELWTQAMALLPNLKVKPQVQAGEGMRLGDCLVETEMGSVDLGVRAQLAEIERGFFDRTREAPGATREKLELVEQET
jgi:flagellar assembly protein FliH